MKKLVTTAVALTLLVSSVAPLAAKEKVRKMDAPKSNWILYLPGKGNKKDAVKDLEKQGWLTSNKLADHVSLLAGDINKKAVLRFDTTEDNVNDAFALPLSGEEKLVTVIFKARGSFDPDTVTVNAEGKPNGTPFGMFYGYVQKGEWQTLLRHNASNQVKGSKSTSRLTQDGTNKTPKIDIVSDWHDFRFVFNVADPENMTSAAFIDGKQVHSDICKKVSFDEETQTLNFDLMSGKGNYLEFGDNDGSTKAFARYAYILVVRDEDVAEMSLEELGKKVKADLVTNPTISNDRGPASKRPAKKPASLNMVTEDFNFEGKFTDKSAIADGVIDLDKLPYSKNAAQKVLRGGADISSLTFAATVDAAGSDGAYKTIAAAIEAVPEGSAIKVMPGLYYEKLVITKPGISLIGTDPAKTIIYGYEADTGNIDGNLLVEVNLLPAGTKTEPGAEAKVPAAAAANAYFNAANITFYNKGAEWNKAWGGAERRSITLALKGVDTCVLENCVFLGQQDTLYWRSGRVYAHNCYIEGDVDYVCGGATVLFDNCHIHTIAYANGGIVVAAAGADTGYSSTAAYAKGYVFKDCAITADKSFEAAKDGKRVTLARGSWVGGSSAPAVQAKTVFINCDIADVVNSAVWADWDSVNTAEKAFFRGYRNSGAGAATLEAKPVMTDDEFNASYASAETILGFTPVLK